jgi:hypothetical protein
MGDAAMPYLHLLRPAQWSKNVFLFAGLVFGHKLSDRGSVLSALLGFACFCLLSSAAYILNDIRDRNEDRLHPRKCKRPIASGRISPSAAAVLAVAAALVGLGGSWLLNASFLAVGVAYLALQTAYTFGLKHVVLLDVFCIGLGFVLRAVAGALAIHVQISHWLVICTFTLCLFMGFSKRRCELSALAENSGETGNGATRPRGSGGEQAARHRKTLSSYTSDLLNHFTTLTAGIAIVSFMLYATDSRTVREFGEAGSHHLVYTLPLVVYAVFRFAYLVEHGLVDGPTDVLMKDRSFQAAIVLWVLAVVVIVYQGQKLAGWLGGGG